MFPDGGGHVLPRSVSTIIANVMNRAGVPGTPHSLRHFFGTGLGEGAKSLANGDPVWLCDLLSYQLQVLGCACFRGEGSEDAQRRVESPADDEGLEFLLLGAFGVEKSDRPHEVCRLRAQH